MRIEAAADLSGIPDWNPFAASHPKAALGHAGVWPRILREAYGLESHLLRAVRGDETTVGVLALARFRSLRGTRSLISLPFLDASGILADSLEAESALLDAALAEARRTGATAVELRQAHALRGVPTEEDPHRVDLRLHLEDDEEAQWKALSGKVRNQTRKATRAEVTLVEGSVETLLDGFYRVFCVNMRDLGSPAHARGFFAAAERGFGERLRFVVGARAGRPIAGLVAIHEGDTVSVPWASTLREERSHCPNNLIYWEALRWAIDRGARVFDFGRSPLDSGTYRFKKGWGAEATPLPWARFGPEGGALAIEGAGQSRLLRGLSDVWTRAPLGLTTWLGPRVRRHLAE